MRCGARDRGTPAQAPGIGCRRWRGEIRKERGGRKDRDAPQEALPASIKGGRRMREGGQIGPENLARNVSRQQKLSKGTHKMAGLKKQDLHRPRRLAPRERTTHRAIRGALRTCCRACRG